MSVKYYTKYYQIYILLWGVICIIPDNELLASPAKNITFRLANSEVVDSGRWQGLSTGLNMMWNGKSLRGESLGFGVPVVHDGKDYYFSHKSKLIGNGYPLVKEFYFDTKGVKRSDGSFRFSRTKKHFGSIMITYTVLLKKIRILVNTDGLHPDADTLFIYNQQSAFTFVGNQDSDINYFKFPTFHDKFVNGYCSNTEPSDASYFYTHDRKLSFGIRCRKEGQLFKTRLQNPESNYVALDFRIISINQSFYYEILYTSPRNQNRY